MEPLEKRSNLVHTDSAAAADKSGTGDAESKDRWIQDVAEADLTECDVDGELLDENSVYRRHGGTIQSAFADPALMLGFCLAYLLFREKQRER
jgi:hypothetical protein